MRRTIGLAACAAAVLVCSALGLAGAGRAGALAVEPWQEGRHARPVRYEPFEVEVLVGGRPLDRYAGRGRLYVEAQRGAEYELRVRNPLPVRVAVALSVDGLNTIDARRTAARDASKWVIQPYGTITVSGWQMSSSRARRFYFTSERDSYAGRLGRAEDVGVITAVFFREREEYTQVTPPRPRPLGTPGESAEERQSSRPTDAAPSARAEAGAGGQSKSRTAAPAYEDDYAATGIGRSVGNDVRWVNLELESRPSSEVTIRYEYRDALVRLGIVPRPHPQPDPLRRRERARGFEDPRFSPEPPQE